MDSYPAQGSTTIAPDVLLTIAQLTTLSTPGVARLSHYIGSSVSRLLKPTQFREGVKIEVDEDVVNADIYVILKHDVNVRDVSHNIQREVTRAIIDMVGMTVENVNIHIDDIDFDNPRESITA